jgi:hypothetical protein
MHGPNVSARSKHFGRARTKYVGDSYTPPAGAPLFAPPAGRGTWAAAHQLGFFSFLVFFLFSEWFLVLFFTDSLDFYFLAGFFGFAGRFSNI